MARPRKNPQDRRSEQLGLPLSPVELAALKAKAESAGTNTTDFARAAALGKRITVTQSTAPDFTTRQELRRIGTNLNQIAKAMNARKEVPPAALMAVIEKLDTLFERWLTHDPKNHHGQKL